MKSFRSFFFASTTLFLAISLLFCWPREYRSVNASTASLSYQRQSDLYLGRIIAYFTQFLTHVFFACNFATTIAERCDRIFIRSSFLFFFFFAPFPAIDQIDGYNGSRDSLPSFLFFYFFSLSLATAVIAYYRFCCHRCWCYFFTN